MKIKYGILIGIALVNVIGVWVIIQRGDTARKELSKRLEKTTEEIRKITGDLSEDLFVIRPSDGDNSGRSVLSPFSEVNTPLFYNSIFVSRDNKGELLLGVRMKEVLRQISSRSDVTKVTLVSEVDTLDEFKRGVIANMSVPVPKRTEFELDEDGYARQVSRHKLSGLPVSEVVVYSLTTVRLPFDRPLSVGTVWEGSLAAEPSAPDVIRRSPPTATSKILKQVVFEGKKAFRVETKSSYYMVIVVSGDPARVVKCSSVELWYADLVAGTLLWSEVSANWEVIEGIGAPDAKGSSLYRRHFIGN